MDNKITAMMCFGYEQTEKVLTGVLKECLRDKVHV